MPLSDFNLKDLYGLEEAARWLLERSAGKKFFAFYGDLGAGKTTLIQEICRQLGVIQKVTSPTFALVNEYNARDNQVIYHFDFYRMEYPEEALDIGFEDYISSGNWCFMEWPEKIDPYLPADLIKVYLDVLPDKSRHIRLDDQG